MHCAHVWSFSLICDCWIITLNWKKKDSSSFLLLLWKRSFIPSIEILPLSHSPHTYYLFKVSFSNNGNKPLKANAVLTVTSLFSASPSSAGSSQQLLEPNKGNPLMAVIVCGWQVPEWQPASRAWYWPDGQEKEEDSWEKIPWHPLSFISEHDTADGVAYTQEGTSVDICNPTLHQHSPPPRFIKYDIYKNLQDNYFINENRQWGEWVRQSTGGGFKGEFGFLLSYNKKYCGLDPTSHITISHDIDVRHPRSETDM